MLASMDIIAFVPTRNPKNAREFFGTTLGLRFVSGDQFALVFDANGVMVNSCGGTIIRVYNGNKHRHFVVLYMSSTEK